MWHAVLKLDSHPYEGTSAYADHGRLRVLLRNYSFWVHCCTLFGILGCWCVVVRARRVYSLAAGCATLSCLHTSSTLDAVWCLPAPSIKTLWCTCRNKMTSAVTTANGSRLWLSVATAEAEVKVGTSYPCLTAHTDSLDQHQPLMLSPLPFTLVWVTGLVYQSGACS